MNAFLHEHRKMKYERLVVVEHDDRKWNQSKRLRDENDPTDEECDLVSLEPEAVTG